MSDETEEQRQLDEWRGDFQAAEEHWSEAALLTTPSQRLAWLEEALAFAMKMGALPKHHSEE